MPVEIWALHIFDTKIKQMTDYQLELTVTSYFSVLIDKSIEEKDVKDFYQRGGVLHIVLENGTIIKEQIKNYYN